MHRSVCDVKWWLVALVRRTHRFQIFASAALTCSNVRTDMMKQASALSKRPHILVCTPGRLVDHLRSSDVLDLSRIKFLV